MDAVDPEGVIVLTRDLHSGVVHKRVRLGKGLATLEGCNLERASAGRYIVLDDGADLAGEHLCERCFPVEIEGAPA